MRTGCPRSGHRARRLRVSAHLVPLRRVDRRRGGRRPQADDADGRDQVLRRARPADRRPRADVGPLHSMHQAERPMAAASFDGRLALDQLRALGMIAAVEMMQRTFPTRVRYSELHGRYARSMPPLLRDLPPAEFCEAVALACEVPPADYALGATRLFLRPGAGAFFEELSEMSIDVALLADAARPNPGDADATDGGGLPRAGAAHVAAPPAVPRTRAGVTAVSANWRGRKARRRLHVLRAEAAARRREAEARRKAEEKARREAAEKEAERLAEERAAAAEAAAKEARLAATRAAEAEAAASASGGAARSPATRSPSRRRWRRSRPSERRRRRARRRRRRRWTRRRRRARRSTRRRRRRRARGPPASSRPLSFRRSRSCAHG